MLGTESRWSFCVSDRRESPCVESRPASGKVVTACFCPTCCDASIVAGGISASRTRRLQTNGQCMTIPAWCPSYWSEGHKRTHEKEQDAELCHGGRTRPQTRSANG